MDKEFLEVISADAEDRLRIKIRTDKGAVADDKERNCEEKHFEHIFKEMPELQCGGE